MRATTHPTPGPVRTSPRLLCEVRVRRPHTPRNRQRGWTDHGGPVTFYDTGERQSTTRPAWWIYDQGVIRERTEQDPAPSQSGRDLPTAAGQGDFGQVKPQELPGVLPRAGTTTLTYDAEMRLSGVTDQANVTQRWKYDAVGRMSTHTVPYKGAGPDELRECTPGSKAAEPATGPIVEQFAYDRNGNRRRYLDGRCQQTLWTYDQFDRATTTEEPTDWTTPPANASPAKTVVNLDRNGNAVKTTLARDADSIERREYDAVDRLKSKLDPFKTAEGSPRSEWTFDYDANGNQTRMTRPGRGGPAVGYVTTKTYDRADQQQTQTDGDENVTEFDYDRGGNQTEVRAPGAGESAADEDPVTRVTHTEYDGRELPWVRTIGTGERARTTITEYDENRNLRRTVNPAGVKDDSEKPGGKAPIWGDTSAALTPSSNAFREATVTEYNTDDQPTATYLPWRTCPLPAGTDCSQTFPDDDKVPTGPQAGAPQTSKRWKSTIAYNDRGWPTRVSEVFNWTGANGPTVSARYSYGTDNSTGWILSSYDKTLQDGPDDVTKQFDYRYDHVGNQTEWATPGRGRKETRSYRPDGQLAERQAQKLNTAGESDETLKRTYRYDYNDARELTELVDLNPPRFDDGSPTTPRTTTIDRDVAGRPSRINETWGAGRDTLYRYLPGGLIDQVKVDGKLNGTSYTGGRTLDYTQDNLDRQTKVQVTDTTDPGSGPDITNMTWWPSGERKELTKANGTTERTYFSDQGELALRSVTKTGQQNPTSRTYEYEDANGERTRDERGSYIYNARGQLTHWVHPGKNTENDPEREVDYQPGGDGGTLFTRTQIDFDKVVDGTNYAFATTATSKNTYDGDQVARTDSTSTTSTVPAGTAPIVDNRTLTFRYSALGSMLSTTTRKGTATDEHVSTQYTYDPFERLLSARDDKNDNGEFDPPTPSTPPGEDESASEVYCYDALDRRDRKITGVESLDTSSETYDDQRAACVSQDAEKTRDYSYLGLTESLTREGDSTTGSAKTYDYDGDANRLGIRARLSSSEPTSRKFRPYEQDAQGSVISVEHAPGDAATVPGTDDTYLLDPYGATGNEKDLSPQAKENPFRFQGHYLDPSVGTYDMQARAYRPALGRFLTQDRFADPAADLTLQTDPLTNNRYTFTAGNPIGKTEDDGHRALADDPRKQRELDAAIKASGYSPVGGGEYNPALAAQGRRDQRQLASEARTRTRAAASRAVANIGAGVNASLSGFFTSEEPEMKKGPLALIGLDDPVDQLIVQPAKEAIDVLSDPTKTRCALSGQDCSLKDHFKYLAPFVQLSPFGAAELRGASVATRLSSELGLVRSFAARAGDEAVGGVYSLRDETGNIVRTGRSNDLARREAEHARDPALGRYRFQPEYRSDDYATQRGLEQLLHDDFLPPLNKIRPISPKNPRFDEYMGAGRAFKDGG